MRRLRPICLALLLLLAFFGDVSTCVLAAPDACECQSGDFALVMVVGTVAGTASSIFVVGSFAVRALSAGPVRSGRQSLPYVLADSSAAVGRR